MQLVYRRTYARLKKSDGLQEQWSNACIFAVSQADVACRVDTVQRVVEGTFNMQQHWMNSRTLGWDHKLV